MRTITPLILALAACGHLPHLDPSPRSPAEESLAAVRVESYCAEGDPTWRPYPEQLPRPRAVFDYGSVAGQATLISEKHAVTAWHVVRCPVIPRVYVTLENGRRVRAIVDREDEVHDLARVTALGAFERWEVGAHPPALRDPFDSPLGGRVVCVSAFGQAEECGVVEARPAVEKKADYAARLRVRPGQSGAGVYDAAGRLAGVVVAIYRDAVSDAYYGAGFSVVDASWLEGT